MLSYRHGYHAGNPADVFKHSVLLALIDAMQQKSSSITCIDTHAGAAYYDLAGDMAQKNSEHTAGIGRLWQTEALNPALQPYLDAMRQANPDGVLRHYPGSPTLIADRLRQQDRAIVCDLHPREQHALRERFEHHPRLRVHEGDGYAALKQYLPPNTKRALVHIDPSYETRDEVARMTRGLEQAMKRFAHGVYAIWYPMIDGREDIDLSHLPDTLGVAEDKWHDLQLVFPEQQRLGRMRGCAMALINTPYRAQASVAAVQTALSASTP
jgi:23S rRNA (adenine2030-N6)-methyltransferase